MREHMAEYDSRTNTLKITSNVTITPDKVAEIIDNLDLRPTTKLEITNSKDNKTRHYQGIEGYMADYENNFEADNAEQYDATKDIHLVTITFKSGNTMMVKLNAATIANLIEIKGNFKYDMGTEHYVTKDADGDIFYLDLSEVVFIGTQKEEEE